jgi:rhodanese-related sulfurtransferase
MGYGSGLRSLLFFNYICEIFRMSKHLWIGFLCLFGIVASSYSQKNKELAFDEFEMQINGPGIQLLDVRTLQEYQDGHIKNSLQADWLNRDQFVERIQYLEKNKPLYVYCGSGVRSKEAGQWLRNNGFIHVLELQNGLIAWKRNKKPIEAVAVVNQMSLSEYQSLLDTSTIVLVDFGATWCPPCRKMQPVFDQLQKELPSNFTLIKINAGIHTEIMEQLHVKNIPGFIIYKNGKEIWRKEGLVSLAELKSQLQ